MKQSIAFLLLLLSPVLPNWAAENSVKPTKAEVDAFRLTMDKVRSMKNAYANLFELIATNSKLRALWKAEAKHSRENSESSSITAIGAHLMQSDPRIVGAFTKAGTSPKEATMTMEAIAGGMIGLAMAESAGVKDVKLEKGVAKDTVDFVRTHKDEIQQTLEQLRTLQDKYPVLKEGLDEEES